MNSEDIPPNNKAGQIENVVAGVDLERHAEEFENEMEEFSVRMSGVQNKNASNEEDK